jgi:hypothetical protein
MMQSNVDELVTIDWTLAELTPSGEGEVREA